MRVHVPCPLERRCLAVAWLLTPAEREATPAGLVDPAVKGLSVSGPTQLRCFSHSSVLPPKKFSHREVRASEHGHEPGNKLVTQRQGLAVGCRAARGQCLYCASSLGPPAPHSPGIHER